MGKVRKSRTKLHLPAVKPDKEKEKEDNLKPNESSLPAIFATAGLFNTTNGDEEKDHQESQKNQQNKKDRRKERHDKFLKKLHASKLVDDSSKKAKERSKTVVVGDMEPLLSALPTLIVPDLNSSSSDKRSGKEKLVKKNKMRSKARQAMQVNEITHFQRVLDHPAFKANPLAAISEHIKNAVEREQENQT